MADSNRVVITGVGLTAPNGDAPDEFRRHLLTGVSGITVMETRFMGRVLAGVCRFDEFKHQSRKERRRGTRAGSISIYCTREALINAGIDLERIDRSRVGTYLGITEHERAVDPPPLDRLLELRRKVRDR